MTTITVSQTSENILVDSRDRITTITLNRPERRNAVDGHMAAELAGAFSAFDDDDDVDVAILTGTGDHFCGGADLKSIGTDRATAITKRGDGPLGPTRLQLSKPVIAAVEGYAVAGGLELAVWCDLRVASETAQFGVFCRRWGVPLVDGGTVRLPRLIGMSRAMDMILTGRAVAAEEALLFGLANRVVPAGTALQAARAFAQQLSNFPQTCMRNDRLSAYEQLGRTELDAMKFETQVAIESLAADGVNGAARFARGAGRHGAFE